MEKFVIYRRVSTKGQGKSGLGLEAQQRDIELFLSTVADYEVVAEFTAVVSGAADTTPELDDALAICRETGATLLVAKLDRLSRRVSKIATLMEDSSVTFRVACMPTADNMSLHIYAALAQQEREFISQRTKSALAAAKARGVVLGGIRKNQTANREIHKRKADEFAAKVMPLIQNGLEVGKTLRQIAADLNEGGTPTANGGKWHATTVQRYAKRAAKIPSVLNVL